LAVFLSDPTHAILLDGELSLFTVARYFIVTFQEEIRDECTAYQY